MIRLSSRPSYRPTRLYCSWTGRFRVCHTVAPVTVCSFGAAGAAISAGGNTGSGDTEDLAMTVTARGPALVR